jgi:hypothetical protein
MPQFTFWELLKTFFVSKRLFIHQWEMYEEKVRAYSRRLGVDRENLKLSAEEVGELLDLKALETLRDAYLVNLKEMSHRMFRSSDSTDTFDRLVSNIFHETSILKEEHYSLKSFGPYQCETNSNDDSILDEVHEFFPRRVRKIRSLFEKARQRIEQLLPQQTSDTILIRSVYLYGENVLSPFFEGPREGFYRKMYPEGGAFEGFYRVGRSFFDSGFDELAGEAMHQALRFRQEAEGMPGVENLEADIDQVLKDIRVRRH